MINENGHLRFRAYKKGHKIMLVKKVYALCKYWRKKNAYGYEIPKVTIL